MYNDENILVTSLVPAEAELVSTLLREEFNNVFISKAEDQFVADLEACKPKVIILAFDSLENAELYYLKMYRQSSLIHNLPHRTLILCNKNDVKRSYALCKNGCFDDYILFWPVGYDTSRLLMSVHHALQTLESSDNEQMLNKLADITRRVAELDTQLETSLAKGVTQTLAVKDTLQQAEININAVIDGFSKKLTDGSLSDALEVKDASKMQNEIKRLHADGIQNHLRNVGTSVDKVSEWMHSTLKKDLAPQLEASRELKQTVKQMRPVILIVDDDSFHRKLMGSLLSGRNFELIFAEGGEIALKMLYKKRPDLILLDVSMPSMNGIEVVRRLKANKAFATIPVIMITANREKSVVIDSLDAGASDFVIKPLKPTALFNKITKHLPK
ncbi:MULTISPECIES: response regulator [Methylomonas]|uniref:Response regulatory domain-containing protein n=1 Tax=Methylomonas koyamae TaxID=702114 RepID=A0A177N426_9GAMM|nr:response regulator [Methylomonas koyamae]OAI12748.1 hypothetical protein A1355_13990 [Methylomonas koyamae]